MELFRGAGVALVTPFHEDKSVNYEVLEQLVERQITHGTDAIIVCGSTGEPATMSEEERLSVIARVVASTKHRIPVIARNTVVGFTKGHRINRSLSQNLAPSTSAAS